MNCCHGRKNNQTDDADKKVDEESAKSIEEDEEEIDPDALKTWQVERANIGYL